MPPFPLTGSVSDTVQDVDGLYAWIDTIPLSRPKRNIARDFADGVLMAEVVSHFLPKYVDLHNYPSASSAFLRKVNWETLNRRVFLKMGIRISDETIFQLIDAKSGIVEQVLMEVHVKIDQLLQSGQVATGRTSYLRSKSQHQYHNHSPGQSSSPGATFIVSRGSSRGKRLSAHNMNNSNSSIRKNNITPLRPVSVPTRKSLDHQSQGQGQGHQRGQSSNANANLPGFKQGYIASPHLNATIGGSHYPAPTPQTAPPPSDVQSAKFPAPWDTVEGFTRTRSQQAQGQGHGQGQGHLGQQLASIPVADVRFSSNDLGIQPSSVSSRPSIKSSKSDRFDEPPNQIIYRGHKMVPLQLLDGKEREMKSLETINRRLTLKIFRLETLVNIKDQRIEDLTHQWQNHRLLYDAISEKNGLAAGFQRQNSVDGDDGNNLIVPTPPVLPSDDAQVVTNNNKKSQNGMTQPRPPMTLEMEQTSNETSDETKI